MVRSVAFQEQASFMSISIYDTARRDWPLSPDELNAISGAIQSYSLEELIEEHGLNDAEFNGESFCVYDPSEADEPGIIFEGATKLPSTSVEVFWAAIQYWCECLSEIRRIVPDATWRVHIDDQELQWDAKRRKYEL
jgi:hypothetical protein